MAQSEITVNLNWNDALATASLLSTLTELAGQGPVIPSSAVMDAIDLWVEESEKEHGE